MKKKKGKVPPHLKKYLFKSKKKRKQSRKRSHHSKGGHVAKKKKKAHHKRHGGKRKTHRRSRHHGGGGGALTTVSGTLPLLLSGAAVGWVEHQTKADATFILNKLPSPVDQLGRLGNLTLLTWGALKLFGKSIPPQVRGALNHGVRAGATVTAYQLVRKQLSGQPFKAGTEVFTIAGLPFDRRAEEQLVDDEEMGELEEEVGRRVRGNFDLEVDEPHPDDGHDLHDEPIHADGHGA